MSPLKDDPLFNTIEDGIKEDIRVVLANSRYRAAVLLIYAGMDAMATLARPNGQADVKGDDFVAWVDRYIRFPCAEQLTGLDLYGARCAMLHNYGSESKLSRQGRCRQVGYMEQSIPEVRFAPSVDPNLVLVSITALASAFFAGVDRFLIESLSNLERKQLVIARLEKMVHQYQYNSIPEGSR